MREWLDQKIGTRLASRSAWPVWALLSCIPPALAAVGYVLGLGLFGRPSYGAGALLGLPLLAFAAAGIFLGGVHAQRPMTVRGRVVWTLLPTLAMLGLVTASIGEADSEGILLVLLYVPLPTLLLFAPFLWTTRRASAWRLALGGAGALTWIVTLLVVLSFAHLPAETDYQTFVLLLGVAFLFAWGAWLSAAFIADGWPKQGWPSWPQRKREGALDLVDDLYVRGLLEDADRDRWRQEQAARASQVDTLRQTLWRRVSLGRQGTLLALVGAATVLMATSALVAMTVGVPACAADASCWNEFRTDRGFFIIVYAMGALGLGVASVLAGAWNFSLAQDLAQAEQDALDALEHEEAARREALLRRARSRSLNESPPAP